MTRNYRKFYALLGTMPGAEKTELARQFTGGRTDSLTAMFDLEFQVMLSSMDGFVSSGAGKCDLENTLRKRVMASIGGWLRACGTTHTPDTIKAIACRAAKRKAFNDITASELRAVYAEFNNKQKVARNTKNLMEQL